MKADQQVYLIFFGSEEKRGQTDPPILEFESREKFDAWFKRGGEQYCDFRESMNGDSWGGWPTWHMIEPGAGATAVDEELDDWLEEYKDSWEKICKTTQQR